MCLGGLTITQERNTVMSSRYRITTYLINEVITILTNMLYKKYNSFRCTCYFTNKLNLLSVGMFSDWYMVSYKTPNDIAFNVMSYIEIFELRTWIIISLSGSVICILFYTIKVSITKNDISHYVINIMYSKVLGLEIFHEKTDSEPFGLDNALALVLSAHVLKSYPMSFKTIPSKVLFVTLSASAYLLFAYYTADLTSMMTTQVSCTS